MPFTSEPSSHVDQRHVAFLPKLRSMAKLVSDGNHIGLTTLSLEFRNTIFGPGTKEVGFAMKRATQLRNARDLDGATAEANRAADLLQAVIHDDEAGDEQYQRGRQAAAHYEMGDGPGLQAFGNRSRWFRMGFAEYADAAGIPREGEADIRNAA